MTRQVEVPGYGTVTVRALTRAQWRDAEREAKGYGVEVAAADDEHRLAAILLWRALVEPRPATFMAEIQERQDAGDTCSEVLDGLLAAIRSAHEERVRP